MACVNLLDDNQLNMYKVPAAAKGARFLRSTGLIEANYQGRWQVWCPWESAWYETYEAYYAALEARENI